MEAVFEVRRCVAFLAMVGAVGLSIVSTAPWMLVVTWGVMIGLGAGSMALVFAATLSRAPVAN